MIEVSLIKWEFSISLLRTLIVFEAQFAGFRVGFDWFSPFSGRFFKFKIYYKFIYIIYI